MSEFITKIFEAGNWGAFKIPFIGMAVLSLLLLMGDLANIEQSTFLQKLVVFVMGAAVISYIHGLMYANYTKLTGKKDLPQWAQWVAAVVHIGLWAWFAFVSGIFY